ncbi:MAG TPA: response regulator [Pirellulaceae bacterium]|nr:response regulator [Pirellulaceae bacterium]HMP68415.1 response regulator [Pirellulaceae bacterium]
MNEKTILLVDDDEVLRERLQRAFVSRGYRVVVAFNADHAEQLLQSVLPDLCVLDLKMPGRTGLEFLKTLKERSPRTKTVMLTGYGSIANAVEAIKHGAINYVPKPADADDLLMALNEKDIGRHKRESSDAEIPQPSLAEAEWQHIQRVLSDSGGNISEAARRLDIPRRTLQRKLKKMAP